MAMEWMAAESAECERRLDSAIPAATADPHKLHEAMRHSLLGGGKRLRPLLCRAAARAITGAGNDCEAAWMPAVAVELIHTYSLIHDDLPALDNDDLRRGRPTCHVVFGEAMAILAGDALLTQAFAVLASAPQAAAMVAVLAEAAGTPHGMVAGQVADMEAHSRVSLAKVRAIHERKTAALLRASVVLGAIAADASPAQRDALARFGSAVGLAFQIADDLLDAGATSAELGKTAGKDAAQDKATWVTVVGVEAATRTAADLIREAEAALDGFGASADHLRELAHLITARRS